MAKPVVDGGKARPPLKWKGRDGALYSGEEGSDRAVERKTSQREAKPLSRGMVLA